MRANPISTVVVVFFIIFNIYNEKIFEFIFLCSPRTLSLEFGWEECPRLALADGRVVHHDDDDDSREFYQMDILQLVIPFALV